MHESPLCGSFAGCLQGEFCMMSHAGKAAVKAGGGKGAYLQDNHREMIHLKKLKRSRFYKNVFTCQVGSQNYKLENSSDSCT